MKTPVDPNYKCSKTVQCARGIASKSCRLCRLEKCNQVGLRFIQSLDKNCIICFKNENVSFHYGIECCSACAHSFSKLINYSKKTYELICAGDQNCNEKNKCLSCRNRFFKKLVDEIKTNGRNIYEEYKQSI